MGYADYFLSMESGAELLTLVISAFQSIGSLISLVMYILMSLGLYTIAQRRELKHAWLAFLPIGNLWILGSIADQYQYVKNGQIRNRRKVLLALQIISFVLAIVLCAAIFFAVFHTIISLDSGAVSEDMVLREMFGAIASSLLLILLTCVVSLLSSIFSWICYYDLFSSCDPKHNTLYLVLGIFFGFLMSIFVFACREKDLGMPPRRTQIPEEI